MKKLFLLLFASAICFSCEKDEENENKSKLYGKTLSENSAFSLESIDNGLDGQILMFNSADAYYSVQEKLFNETESYTEGYQSRIPRDLSDDRLEIYLKNIGYNEDIVYEEFEKSVGFNSFRAKLNKDEDLWLDKQINPKLMDDVGDPDDNTLVLESDRTLYNEGGEVIVLDSLKKPLIYKAFDWGHLVIEDFDTKILKEINVGGLKTIESIKTKFPGKTNIKFLPDNMDYASDGFCQYEGIKSKKHVYSPNGLHNVKSIIKKRVAVFGWGNHDRLLIKTKGYLWKRGKWRHRSVWLVSGFTSKKDQPNLPITWYEYACDGAKHSKTFKAKTKCALKYEYESGPYGQVAIKDNTVYAYHGQGTFTFTVDFFGTKNTGHEVYTITN